jgi:hypothetical protein
MNKRFFAYIKSSFYLNARMISTRGPLIGNHFGLYPYWIFSKKSMKTLILCNGDFQPFLIYYRSYKFKRELSKLAQAAGGLWTLLTVKLSFDNIVRFISNCSFFLTYTLLCRWDMIFRDCFQVFFFVDLVKTLQRFFV